MFYDVIIIGGGVAGMSCALVLGSAHKKDYAKDKHIGIIMHQRTSSLERGLFNNVLGIEPGTTGKEILKKGRDQLAQTYPHVSQIDNEKVNRVEESEKGFVVFTNKTKHLAKIIVVAIGPSNLFQIEGLMQYVERHPNLPSRKERVQLRNVNHLVEDNIYVAGVLAGWRSQFATAAGSGAHVATDILTLWNDGNTSMVHDSTEQ